MNTIHIERGQDWVKVFRDGTLLQEGHSIQTDALLTSLGFTVTTAGVAFCAWCEATLPEGTTDEWGVCPKCREEQDRG